MSEVAREDLKKVLNGLDPYSDYTYGSLRYWDTGDRLRLSGYAGNLVVKFFDYLTGEEFYSLAGTSDVAGAADSLASEYGIHELALLPEPVAMALAEAGWTIVPDRDQYDYVIDLQEWTELAGGRHHRRRRTLKSFLSKHAQDGWSMDRVDDWSQVTTSLTQIRSTWAKNNPDRARLASEEAAALDRVASIGGSDAELDVFVLSIRGKPEAFEIHEALGDGWGVAHFGKCAGNSSEAETVLELLSARYLLETRGVRWLNVEQDLGLPGLRQRKLHHRPARLLAKFTATSPTMAPNTPGSDRS